jgi:hypothetical protein
MTQEVKHRPTKYKALSSSLDTTKKKKMCGPRTTDSQVILCLKIEMH